MLFKFYQKEVGYNFRSRIFSLNECLVGASVFFALFFTACNTTPLENAINSFNLVIELPKINTTSGIAIQNAESKELLDVPVTVTFTGEYSDKILDMYSDPINNVVINNGLLNIGLDNSIIPTEESPIVLTMEIIADGFIPSKKQIVLTQTGKLSHVISMVSREIPPPGVFIQETISGMADKGEIIDSIYVSIEENGSEENTGIRVMFPVGSILEAEDGSAPTGAFQVNTTLFDAEEQEALAELNPDLIAPLNDSIVVIVSAVDLDLRDNSGRLITRVEPSLVAKTTDYMGDNQSENASYILNFVLNSTTYSELQQLLRLAYIRPTTAERVIINTIPQVSSLPDGRVLLRYALNNEVFRQAALVYFSEQPIDIRLDFNRNGNEGKLPIILFEKGFTRNADLQAESNSLTLRNVTRGMKTVSIGLDYTEGGRHEQIIEVGTESTFQIELPSPPATLIDVTVSVILVCTNPNEFVRLKDIPSSSLLYRLSNAPSGTAWRSAQNLTWDYDAETQSLRGGSANVYEVEIGSVYDFKFYYDSNMEKGSEEVTGEKMEYKLVIDSDVCR